MRHLSAWVLLCLLALAARPGRAQTPAYGDWQLHLSATFPLLLADAGNQLYVADESSFYVYDKTLNASRFLSRRDGLSDVDVRAMAYDSASAQLLLVYANGNIDLLATTGAVRNITDLLRKQASKEINQVQIVNGLAYVSSSLGVVVLDLARREVRDTYGTIGPGGQQVTAYATAVLHDTIWAATSGGLLRGRLSATVNLLDYRNWTLEPADPQMANRVYKQLAAYQGHLVASSTDYGVTYKTGVGTAQRWRRVPGNYGNVARRLRVSRGQLLITFDNGPLGRLDLPTGQFVELLPLASVGPGLRDAVRGADNTLYAASYGLGLLRFVPGGTRESIRPNGPESAKVFGLTADAATNTVDVFTGGYGGNGGFGQQAGFYEYSAGRWTNYTSANYPSLTDFPNPLDLLHGTRTADGKLYIASYGNGLLEWEGPGRFRQFTFDTNFGGGVSPLRSSLSPDANYLNFVRVTDVAADPNGQYVWVVNRHQRNTQSGLFRLRPATSSWQVATWAPGFENLDRVVVDSYGNPWASQSRLGGVGVVAYDTASHQPFVFTASSTTTGPGTGIPNNTVYALARDRKGAIWIGTGQGVAYVGDPSSLLNGQVPAFTQPYAQSGNGRFPTLYNETVRCIAVDGANRKWFGTPNGLWLFSPDADKALLNFTTANSPLPSNSIVDVAINDRTGEVFVATDAGVVSYQGSASVTEGSPSCAEVFPNPVRPEFAGAVGIRGVANNAQVKITDVAGHLVYSTTAAGGTVTWNLTDPAGRRVRSGIYLVLTADAEGKNTCVSKVAVLSN